MADLRNSPNELHEQSRLPLPAEQATVAATAEANVAGADTRLSSRYAIERLHAQGGLGRVSLANDSQLKRSVAVKEIRPDRRTDEARRRFINEAEITGQLEHPGIVPIYALETDAAGEPYYVMRFIQGRPLSDAVREYHCGPTHLAFRELLQRFTSVCQTIAYAHSRGVLHRDLKPANVMLGEFGETLVVDWGLAKKLQRPKGPEFGAESSSAAPVAASQESTVDSPGENISTIAHKPAQNVNQESALETEMGQMLGTPAYMAPEQAAGRWDQVGPASDIYSLGAMLYGLLTGKTAVHGMNGAEMRGRIQRGDFPAPRQVQADVPRALQAVCLKAMALEPAQRYASAKDLAEDIEHWLADEPVTAYAELWYERGSRWLRKNRLLIASAAALLVTALVAATIGLVAVEAERSRTETARKKTAEALTRVTAEEQKAQAALVNEMKARQRTHAALNTLTDDMLERLLTRQTHIGDAEKAYLRHVQKLYQEFAADTGGGMASRQLSASGHYRVAGIHANLNELEEAEAGYREAIALYSQLAAEFPQELRHKSAAGDCRQSLGLVLRDLGRYREAEQECRQAITLRNELIAVEPQVSHHRHRLAGCYINLGISLAGQGKTADEVSALRQALQLQEKLVADEPRMEGYRVDLAKIHGNLGVTLKSQGKIPEAIQHLQRAIDLQKGLVVDFSTVPDHRGNLAASQARLANLFRERGRRAEAEPIYREAMSVQEELAAEFPIVLDYRTQLAATYSNFGGVVRENGQPEACLEWFTKCIDLLRPALAQDNNRPVVRQFVRTAHWGRALALDQLFRRDEALRDWDLAVELSTETDRPQVQMPRAASLAGAGRYKEAVEEANRLVKGATAEIHYDAACVHALASAAVKDNEQLQHQYAARAIELLFQAKAGGLFSNRAMVAYIRTDNDLKPLRERDDFKKLVAELEMPEPTRKN